MKNFFQDLSYLTEFKAWRVVPYFGLHNLNAKDTLHRSQSHSSTLAFYINVKDTLYRSWSHSNALAFYKTMQAGKEDALLALAKAGNPHSVGRIEAMRAIELRAIKRDGTEVTYDCVRPGWMAPKLRPQDAALLVEPWEPSPRFQGLKDSLWQADDPRAQVEKLAFQPISLPPTFKGVDETEKTVGGAYPFAGQAAVGRAEGLTIKLYSHHFDEAERHAVEKWLATTAHQLVHAQGWKRAGSRPVVRTTHAAWAQPAGAIDPENTAS